MEFGRLVSRSFELVRHNRVLWIFGILLALVGGGGSTNFNFQSNTSIGNPQQLPGGIQLPQLPAYLPQLPFSIESFIPILVAIMSITLALALLFSFLRAIFDGGLIALASQADAGQALSFGHGWQQGRTTMLRVWLIDFMLYLPVTLFVLAVVVVIISTVITALTSDTSRVLERILPVIFTLIFPSIWCVLFASVFLDVFSKVAKRISVLENRSWSDSIRASWGFISQYLLNTFIIWLIFGIISALCSFVLSLPFIAIFFLAVLTVLFNPNPSIMLIVGLVLMLLLMALLYNIILGVVLSFYSTGWTLFVKWTLHPPVPVVTGYQNPYTSGYQPPSSIDIQSPT